MGTPMTRLPDGTWTLNRFVPPKVKKKYMKPADPPTVPCTTCGRPTTSCGTKKCDCCWEVEARLPEYLSTPGGRARVAQMLASATGAGPVHPAVGEALADMQARIDDVVKH